jgi:hypothetical protein
MSEQALLLWIAGTILAVTGLALCGRLRRQHPDSEATA